MNKKYIFIFVCLLITLVVGITFAYFSWSSNDINFNMTSGCFDILYTKGQDISGSMMPSDTYAGGLYTTIKINIKNTCTINGNGKLYLETFDTTSKNLYRAGLLNYQVLKGSTVTDLKGSITSSGVIELDIGTIAKSASAYTEYKVYVWIDNDVVQNSDFNLKYSGRITAKVVQEG